MAIDIFQPFTNPIAGETFQCLSFDEAAYVMEWTVQPEGYVPFEHVHLRQDEVFHIQQGELRLLIEGKEVIARAGTSVTVPKGKRHVAFNNNGEILKCIIEYRPGLDHLKMFQCFAGLTLDKDYDERGKINIPKMGFFLKHMKCQAIARPTSIPAPIFGLALNIFYLMGIINGWKQEFVRYTGRER